MFKIALKQVFDNFNVNLRKNEGFLTSIPCFPIPKYGRSNAPLERSSRLEEQLTSKWLQVSVIKSSKINQAFH